jgi:hypothetical protein
LLLDMLGSREGPARTALADEMTGSFLNKNA